MSLVQEQISLSENQIKKLVRGIKADKVGSFRLSASQVKEGRFPVFVDAAQANRIQQARLKNKGVVIRFGETMSTANRQEGGILPAILELAKRQDGGILPALIPILVALGTAAGTAGVSFATDRILKEIFPEKKAKGIFPLGVSPTDGQGLTPLGSKIGGTICPHCGK